MRAKNGSGSDPANRFLDHGNYLAYGLGATAAWVLGLPHGLAVLHGKTRRGAPIPWGDIPARPFVGLSSEDKEAVLETIAEALERAAQGR